MGGCETRQGQMLQVHQVGATLDEDSARARMAVDMAAFIVEVAAYGFWLRWIIGTLVVPHLWLGSAAAVVGLP